VPELILIEIAAALAAKATESLYNLVKNKFEGRKQALDALNAAADASPDSPQVIALAEELATAEAYDPQFSRELRSQWTAIKAQTVASAADDGVANTISGPVTGNVVQARDVHGNITFGV
jgi:hypothetical protein